MRLRLSTTGTLSGQLSALIIPRKHIQAIAVQVINYTNIFEYYFD
jgi:hypothetical protein